MKRIVSALAVIGVLPTAACSGDAYVAEETTTTEAQSAETTLAAPDSSRVDACIAALISATADVDLDAPDAEAQLDSAFGPGEPVECSFFDDGPESVGLTPDELYKALEDGLPADLFEFIGSPSEEQFENTEDEL